MHVFLALFRKYCGDNTIQLLLRYEATFACLFMSVNEKATRNLYSQ